MGVALWLPHQDGVGSEGGHAVLYEQAPEVMMDVRGPAWGATFPVLNPTHNVTRRLSRKQHKEKF